MNEFRAHKIDGPNALLVFKIGELKLWYWGGSLIGAQTEEGTHCASVYSLPTRIREAVKTKQQQVGLNASWVGKRSERELQEIISRAMLREYAKFARERMAGET